MKFCMCVEVAAYCPFTVLIYAVILNWVSAFSFCLFSHSARLHPCQFKEEMLDALHS